MEYTELRTRDDVATYLKALPQNIISLDIEGDYNLHAYGEKVCLIQIYDGQRLSLLDPLKFDSAALSTLFENPRLLKVMYGAASDLSMLKNGYGLECKAVLDLQPALKLLGYTQLNLHAVLHACLGVELDHKKKFQKYNWTRRPLDPDAITYALQDVYYLLALKDLLLRQLYERGLLEQFFLENMLLQHKDYTRTTGQRLRKSRQFQALSPARKQIFETLFELREQCARQMNIPPHQLLENPDLFALARDPARFEQFMLSRRLHPDLAAAFRQAIAAIPRNTPMSSQI